VDAGFEVIQAVRVNDRPGGVFITGIRPSEVIAVPEPPVLNPHDIVGIEVE